MDGGGDGRRGGRNHTAALSARQRLGPLLNGIDDPFLRALCQLALAWTSAIVDDLDGALWEASASLDELRGQDVLSRTASAGLTSRLGGDDRRTLLRRLRSPDRGARPGGSVRQRLDRRHVPGWAWAPWRWRGAKLEEARALLDEALERAWRPTAPAA